MTKTNNERLAVMETEMKNIKKSLDDNIKHNSDNFKLLFEKIDGMKDDFTDKIDGLPKKFANKWVERFILGLIGTAGGAIIIGVIYLLK